MSVSCDSQSSSLPASSPKKKSEVVSEFVHAGLKTPAIEQGGVFKKHIHAEHFVPLVGIARNNILPLEFLFDYYNYRFHLLLERNQTIPKSIENEQLDKLHRALDECDFAGEESSTCACLELFWPFVSAHCHDKSRGAQHPSSLDKFIQKPIIKIRAKTSENGLLEELTHSASLNYPLSYPIENPCPTAHLFKKDEVQYMKDIDSCAFKVKINDEVCCLKVGREKYLRREALLLAKMPSHPSLPRLVGLVEAAEGKVDQIVTPFITGVSLDRAQPTSEKQKQTWKEQMSDAVAELHKNNLVWGDVNPSNVMIEEETRKAVLIDFGGGAAEGWVSSRFKNSKEGDVQGLGRLLEYIDRMEMQSNWDLN